MQILRAIVAAVGDALLRQISTLGGVARLSVATFSRLFRPPLEVRLTVRELEQIGWQSIGVVCLVGMSIGMVLVVQTGYTLKRFGAEVYASEMVALAMVREMGPLLAGFLVAGRVGSGIAAEIGSMAISEQIDAMRSLGADPLKKLVLPKALAAIIGLPLLTALCDLIGILGGMLMAATMLNVAPFSFFNRIRDAVTVGDFMSGVMKTAAFGAIIAMVGCYYGLHTSGGTVGVGRSATASVVLSCVLILVADLVLTTLFFAVGGIVSV